MQERNPFGAVGYPGGDVFFGNQAPPPPSPEPIPTEAQGDHREPQATEEQSPEQPTAASTDEIAAKLRGVAVVVQAGYSGDIWFGLLDSSLYRQEGVGGEFPGWALALRLRSARKTGDAGLAALASAGPGPDDAVSPILDVVHLSSVHVVATPTVEAIKAWLEAPAFTFPKDDPALRRAYANQIGFGRRL